MSENINQLVKYLKSENIKIDKKEFIYQFDSHPDSPSLLALSDTLSFFKIRNGAFKVAVDELSNMPDNFMASLKGQMGTSIYFIQKRGENFSYEDQSGKKKFFKSKNELKDLWEDVVLLIDGARNTTFHKSSKNNKILKTSVVLTFLLFIGLYFLTYKEIDSSIFYLLPLAGLLFSLAAYKDLFFPKSGIIDKFCGLTSSSSCETIINSTKWKVFEYVKFSDLSVVFFATQFIGYFMFLQLAIIQEYFILQKILILLSTPVILLSLYFQGMVEKKWCPICLSISSILLVEAIIVFYFYNFPLYLNVYSFTLYFLVFFSVTTIWMYLKENLEELGRLKVLEIKANKFKRTYSVFKNSLFSGKVYHLPNNKLILGNPSAPVSITFVTSPFCSHCLEPYRMFQNLLREYGEEISVSIVYNVHEKNERLKVFAENIFQGYLKYGEKYFFEAMDYWYDVKDFNAWLKRYEVSEIDPEVPQFLNQQRAWLTHFNFNFTPILFLNTYRFPEAYEITDLTFLMDEILYDFKKIKENRKISEAV